MAKQPKIRFKGFSEEWKEAPLGQLVKEHRVSNQLVHHQNLLSLSYGKIVRRDIHANKGLLPASFDTYQIIDKDTIVFRVTDLQNDKKSLRVAISEEEGIISPAYVCVDNNSKDITASFLHQILHYHDVITKIYYKMGDGLRQTLNYADLKSLNIVYPKPKEQKGIANLLDSFDVAISQREKELEKLKNIKRALLERMFPQDGQNTPSIRFKGFTDEWKEKKFGELYNRAIEKNDLSFGSDRIISVANMYFRPDTSDSSEEYMRTYNIMRIGDIAYEGNKSGNYAYGRWVENYIGDGIVSHVFEVLRPKVEYDLMYWRYAINNENIMRHILLKCTKKATMMTNIVIGEFLKQSILVPHINEQKKIGNFLAKLDSILSLRERQLTLLKHTKQALLEQMFVNE